MSDEGKGKETVKESEINFDPLINGASFIKHGALGKPHETDVKISMKDHMVIWSSKKKSSSKTRIAFHDIKEVREGMKTKKFGKGNSEEEDRAFSIIYGGDHKTLDLVAQNKDVKDIWVGALKQIMSDSKSSDPIKIFLQQAWTKADKNGDGKLDMDEIMKLLKTLNVNLSKSQVKASFKEVDGGKGYLDFEAFNQFYKNLKYRKEIEDIFKELSKGGPLVSSQDLQKFLVEEQKMTFQSDDELAALVKKYSDDEFSKDGNLSLEGFSKLLYGESDIWDSSKLEKYEDMNRPLTHYWINSSHNTYLLEDQLKGPSSVEAYIHAFQKGCRCVELDCWDGPNGPIVYHGHTLTSKILFEDVIKTVKDYAFAVSDYPVILSLEVHTSLEQQTQMAEIMKKHIGHLIVTDPLPDDAEFLPSPESLKNKILVKGKSLPKDTKPEDYETEDEDDDDDDEPAEVKEMKEKEGKKKGAKVKVSQELSDLVTYCKTAGFKSFKESKEKCRPDQMSSFAEGKSEKLAANQRDEFIEYNRRQLSRIYPAGGRVDSSNYPPHLHWNAGCQIVAFNFQTLDRTMQLNIGKYMENGNTGYLLKPAWMLKDGEARPSAKKLQVKVISGQQLPKPGQSAKGEVIDPYVEVDICGEADDCVSKKTKTINDNGFNPQWNESFDFSVKSPDLTLVRFAVYDKDIDRDDFIAFGVVPFHALKTGYRHVKLRDSKNSPLQLSSLFVHITVTDA